MSVVKGPNRELELIRVVDHCLKIRNSVAVSVYMHLSPQSSG